MYLGILGPDRREPRNGSGYHRIDLSRHNFKISPGMDASDAMTFINTTTITFSRTVKPWGQAQWFAVFDEVDSAKPSMMVPLKDVVFLTAGMIVSVAPGQLQFGVWWRQPELAE